MRHHLAAALAASLAVPAWASDTVSIGGTMVTLQPGEHAPLVVEMRNRNVNHSPHDGEYTVTRDGVTVSLFFKWNATDRESNSGPALLSGADRLDVLPPPGWMCVPATCRMDVPEDQVGVIELHRASVGY